MYRLTCTATHAAAEAETIGGITQLLAGQLAQQLPAPEAISWVITTPAGRQHRGSIRTEHADTAGVIAEHIADIYNNLAREAARDADKAAAGDNQLAG